MAADNIGTSLGRQMHGWATDLFPICRSITGNGVRETLEYFRALAPGLTIHEVPSGSKAFDWTVTDEWNIRNAYVMDENGRKVIDFKNHNLHVVGYSEPVDQTLPLEELDKHLHSIEDKPDAIPYVTSYYKRRWGLCLPHKERLKLAPGNYRVKIDSTLGPGSLTYGELILPGKEKGEILLSTYACHPSMANNELSGPVVTIALARWLMELPERRYTYRIVIAPETIGSITYLSRNLDRMKKETVAGFAITCVGDEGDYSFVETRLGGTLTDKVVEHVLKHHAGGYSKFGFLEQGGCDERQYCSPGVDLPVVLFARSKPGSYPEYHTSQDDLSLITPDGLEGSFEALKKCIMAIEKNRSYRSLCLCEPQLGKRGLYPTLSTLESARTVHAMMNLIAYSDGQHDLLSIIERLNQPIESLFLLADDLLQAGIIGTIENVA